MAYRGTGDANTKVDRPDEGLDTEHAGVGGTGKSRSTFDDQTSGKPRGKGANTVLNTDGFTEAVFDATERAIDSAD